MADIKTRDAVKGTIKQIDKAAVAADRMRVAFIQTKEKAEHSTHAHEANAEEYASDRIEGGIDRVSHEAAHQFDKQGRKGVKTTRENISKAKDGIQQFKEKRAENSIRRQSAQMTQNGAARNSPVRTPRNKSAKIAEQTQKTVMILTFILMTIPQRICAYTEFPVLLRIMLLCFGIQFVLLLPESYSILPN